MVLAKEIVSQVGAQISVRDFVTVCLTCSLESSHESGMS
jgi:hypothetical protein